MKNNISKERLLLTIALSIIIGVILAKFIFIIFLVFIILSLIYFSFRRFIKIFKNDKT